MNITYYKFYPYPFRPVLKPINFNIAQLLRNKVARIIAIKRGLLGGIFGIFPLRPRPFKPSIKPSYQPPGLNPQRPPRPSYDPPPQVPSTPAPQPIVPNYPDSKPCPINPAETHPSYRAPGYYDPSISSNGNKYHTNVESVIKVVDDTENTRFPSGKEQIA